MNAEETNYVLVPRHQNAGQNQNIEIDNGFLFFKWGKVHTFRNEGSKLRIKSISQRNLEKIKFGQ
jgi:hypothetical protein